MNTLIDHHRPGKAQDSARRRTAAYIEELVREMEALASQEKIEPLRDLLRLAREEARRAALSMGEA